jgi:hypothetical protein
MIVPSTIARAASTISRIDDLFNGLRGGGKGREVDV